MSLFFNWALILSRTNLNSIDSDKSPSPLELNLITSSRAWSESLRSN